MAAAASVEQLVKVMDDLLEETFAGGHGYYIDPGSSLFETLADISAAQASTPVGGQGATLAAKVKHLAFSLEVSERVIRTGDYEQYDWGKIWRETGAVTVLEWVELQAELRHRYDRIKALLATEEASPDAPRGEKLLQEALVTLVHAAYHLGEIREALVMLRQPAPMDGATA